MYRGTARMGAQIGVLSSLCISAACSSHQGGEFLPFLWSSSLLHPSLTTFFTTSSSGTSHNPRLASPHWSYTVLEVPPIFSRPISFPYVIFPSLSNFISFHNLAALYGSRRWLYSHRAPHVVEAGVLAAPDYVLNGVAMDFRRRIGFQVANSQASNFRLFHAAGVHPEDWCSAREALLPTSVSRHSRALGTRSPTMAKSDTGGPGSSRCTIDERDTVS
ncbi:hypothetical protein B0H10DRAFT_1949665 [Mycena sp. CBHHK59/15]|nr:hypothetical protein B0H10DRAFT_1949665 [Mycena sp. CBHHK59/15]